MFPFLSVCIFILGIIVYECVIINNYKHKKKIVHIKKVQNAKKHLIIFAIIGILLFSYTTYMSFDLIKKDYVVCEAEFVESYKRGRSSIYSVHFVDGENEYVLYANSEENNRLEERKNYVITYGKRTKRIVEIHQSQSAQ